MHILENSKNFKISYRIISKEHQVKLEHKDNKAIKIRAEIITYTANIQLRKKVSKTVVGSVMAPKEKISRS